MYSILKSEGALLVALICAWLLGAVTVIGADFYSFSLFAALGITSLSIALLAGFSSLIVIACRRAKQLPLSRRTIFNGGFGLITFLSAFVILTSVYEFSQCNSTFLHCDFGWATKLLDALFF